MDVDGVLNPFKARPRPDGYATFRLVHPDGEPPRWGRRRDKGEPVWLNREHGRLLRSLAGDGAGELAWASTWGALSNTLIGPELGLAALPVIPLPAEHPHEHRPTRHWKRASMAEYAGGRPLVWLDDEFVRPGDFAWATERTAAGAPTLLVHVDARIGLTGFDIDAAASWIAGITCGAEGEPR